MSYIQVEIGGKLRGLKFNQGAHAEIAAIVGESTNAVFAGYAVVYGGLVANSYIKREEPDFTFEDVCDWSEKISIEDMTAISECYKSTLAFLQDVPAEPEDDKKKLPDENIS